MKTSRVRVHRNSVYITAISRITSWRANEQSIVLTPPTENLQKLDARKISGSETGARKTRLIDT